MSITIVGLGSGDGRLLTREAWETLSQTHTLYLRTQWHPAVADLPAHIVQKSFDHLYETADDFADVYDQITEQIMTLGHTQEVVYAVPGHPFIGESTALAIWQRAQREGVAVRMIDGLSFVEPTLSAVNRHVAEPLDGLDGLQIYDALEINASDYPRLNADRPLLIGQVYSSLVAGDLKLNLNAIYPDQHPVWLVHGAGTAAEQVESLSLYEIDQSIAIQHLTSLYVPPLPQASDLTALAETVATLRSPHGCPWDRRQTPQTMRAGFLEEVSEALEALDNGDAKALCEELGDVLLHITMQTQMAAEDGLFTLSDVIAGIVAKLIRRHPHVWGTADGSAPVHLSWEEIKRREKASQPPPTSILEDIPPTLPALAQSQKIQKRVQRVGFDWPSLDGVYHKLQEEMAELQTAETKAEQRQELGDVLFVAVNLAKWLGLDAEIALREANLRFSRRFRLVETLAKTRQQALTELDEDTLLALWEEAKEQLTAVESEALER